MLYVYQSKERGVLNLNDLIKNVVKVKKLERKIASVCEKKAIQFNNKWKSTGLIIIVLRSCFDFLKSLLLLLFLLWRGGVLFYFLYFVLFYFLISF